MCSTRGYPAQYHSRTACPCALAEKLEMADSMAAQDSADSAVQGDTLVRISELVSANDDAAALERE